MVQQKCRNQAASDPEQHELRPAHRVLGAGIDNVNNQRYAENQSEIGIVKKLAFHDHAKTPEPFYQWRNA
jgi:hypothetical protein